MRAADEILDAQDRIAKLKADNMALLKEISVHAAARGEAEGRLRMSEKAGIVEGWRERALVAESLTLSLAAELGTALSERNAAMVKQCAAARDAAALTAELEALKRSEDEARVIADDGELNANPPLLIEHLTQQCRDFIRERDDERRYSKRLEAEQDEASARHILLATRVEQLEAALKPFCFGDPMLEAILYDGMPDSATGTFTISLGDLRRARAALSGGADAQA